MPTPTARPSLMPAAFLIVFWAAAIASWLLAIFSTATLTTAAMWTCIALLATECELLTAERDRLRAGLAEVWSDERIDRRRRQREPGEEGA